MHSIVDELYKRVKDLMTKDEFYQKIRKKMEDFDHLIDDEAAAMLIIDDLGRNRQNITPIKDLKPDCDCTLFGKVISIDEPLEFKRKNGSRGRVINLKISDNTGTCNLVLWDDDVDLVGNIIQVGSTIKIVNGYTKEHNSEIEVNVGRWGSIEVEPPDAPVITNHVENRIEGRVVKKDNTRPYFKDNGEFGFVRVIWLDVDGEIKKITVWDEHTKTFQSIEVGERVIIKNFYERGKEIHVNSHSVIAIAR